MRIVDQRAGDRHPLLLTAGKLGGLMRFAMRKPDLGQAFLGLLPRALMAVPRVKERQRNVVDGGAAREQIEVLEDEADLLVAIERKLVRAKAPELAALDLERTRGRRVERTDEIHEGRLAGTRRTGHG